MNIELFSYDVLDPEPRERLKEAETYINARIERNDHLTRQMDELKRESYQQAVEIGTKLVEMKALLPGEFLRWRRFCFGFSDDTAENLMNVARNMPALPDGEYTQAALYELSKPKLSSEVQERVSARAAAGAKIDRDEVYLQTSAPEWLLQRYLDADLAKKDAVGLTRAYLRASETVQAIVQHENFSSGTAVDYLQIAYDNREKSSRFDDLRAAKFHLEGVGVHLGQATERDINTYTMLRQQSHVQQALIEKDERTVGELVFNVPVTGPSIMIVDATIAPFKGKMARVYIRFEDGKK